MTGSRRIFVAVQLAPALQEAVALLERRLEEAGARLRWVKPENLHFTLRFLGHISEAELARVRAATHSAASGFAPFAIGLRSVGAFPGLRQPQVVWLGVDQGAQTLVELAHRLDEGLVRQGFERETREFHPHLTLARLKDQRLGGAVGRVLAQFEGEEVGRQDVASLQVMESLLRPQGPLYIQVEEVPLRTHEN